MKKLTLALALALLCAAPFAFAEVPAKFSFAEWNGKLGTQPKKKQKIVFPRVLPDAKKRQAMARGVFGDIRVVESGEDFRVKIVKYGEDISIVQSNFTINEPGYWHFVKSVERFRVRFVDYMEDFSIRYVPAHGL